MSMTVLGSILPHGETGYIIIKPSRCKQKQEFDKNNKKEQKTNQKKIVSYWYGLNLRKKPSLKAITPGISQVHDSKNSFLA